MKTEITPELIRTYFHGGCTAAEKQAVENWLKSSDVNYSQAMRWLKEEESEDDERFLASLLMSEDEVWRNTQEAIDSKNDGYKLNSRGGRGAKKARGFWYAAAATVSLVILTTWAVKSYVGSKVVTVRTAFEETKRITLPDNSVVILNSNSSLSYVPAGFAGERTVRMKGEAFFEVNHMANHARFQVHLSEDKIVEVLGTEFNVSDRKHISQIVLKSGRVRLDIPREKQNITLAPGEMVEVNEEAGSVVKQRVNTELFYSWINGKWKFERASLKDILSMIEETRGVKVNVYKPSLKQRTISGTIPLKGDATTLVTNVANAFDLVVENREGTFYLKERK
jgi:transmembrane sensor